MGPQPQKRPLWLWGWCGHTWAYFPTIAQ